MLSSTVRCMATRTLSLSASQLRRPVTLPSARRPQFRMMANLKAEWAPLVQNRASMALEDDEIERLWMAFKEMDTNNNGILEKPELATVLAKAVGFGVLGFRGPQD
eukprot:CAMPEP_0184327490 /NCGR_PEP_ID=MMETSP1049-20130417/143117_1 /TAXON_ID=77928 /ORGANISM="Proteomonas sulcata, Strain CCMP704" /LENGTH=105 /DNA_ID=CAMNT_0026649749 /DNA_START=185 /DNA_END=502 /DNA_ORIENTATION=+